MVVLRLHQAKQTVQAVDRNTRHRLLEASDHGSNGAVFLVVVYAACRQGPVMW